MVSAADSAAQIVISKAQEQDAKKEQRRIRQNEQARARRKRKKEAMLQQEATQHSQDSNGDHLDGEATTAGYQGAKSEFGAGSLPGDEHGGMVAGGGTASAPLSSSMSISSLVSSSSLDDLPSSAGSKGLHGTVQQIGRVCTPERSLATPDGHMAASGAG